MYLYLQHDFKEIRFYKEPLECKYDYKMKFIPSLFEMKYVFLIRLTDKDNIVTDFVSWNQNKFRMLPI